MCMMYSNCTVTVTSRLTLSLFSGENIRRFMTYLSGSDLKGFMLESL